MEESGGMFLDCDIEAYDTHTGRERKVPNVRGQNSGRGKRGAYSDTPLYHYEVRSLGEVRERRD
jgi:hypothetical protein